ncbi:MAG: hypothetical protein U1E74_10215 [Paenacidovorax caeni]
MALPVLAQQPPAAPAAPIVAKAPPKVGMNATTATWRSAMPSAWQT